MSAITLRSGKELQATDSIEKNHADSAEHSAAAEKSNSAETDADEREPELSKKKDSRHSELNIPLPFPNKVTQNKKIAEAKLDKEIMETFRKVEVIIPLFDAIK